MEHKELKPCPSAVAKQKSASNHYTHSRVLEYAVRNVAQAVGLYRSIVITFTIMVRGMFLYRKTKQ